MFYEFRDKIEVKDLLKLNAGLQKKKNALRAELAERGVLKRQGRNGFDRYSYFSEAQYKELFTELFSKHGLELSFDEIEYGTYTADGKQPFGRAPRLLFILTDTDTGFYETTEITGEGLDKGDKAGYKAYTGALKYYLATTFMVATGDDSEKESPEGKPKMTAQATKPVAKASAPVQAPPEIAPDRPITTEAARKVSNMVATIHAVDTAWWEGIKKDFGFEKSTQILQRDYATIVTQATKRLTELRNAGLLDADYKPVPQKAEKPAEKAEKTAKETDKKEEEKPTEAKKEPMTGEQQELGFEEVEGEW